MIFDNTQNKNLNVNYDELVLIMNNSDEYLGKYLLCEYNVLNLEKINEQLILTIKVSELNTFIKIIQNLPHYIDILNLDFSQFDFVYKDTKCLDHVFRNLPINLNALNFIYKENHINHTINEYAQLNCLFDIKLPMNCKVLILIGKCIYETKLINKCTMTLTVISPKRLLFYNKNSVINVYYNAHKRHSTGGGGGGGLMQLFIYG